MRGALRIKANRPAAKIYSADSRLPLNVQMVASTWLSDPQRRTSAPLNHSRCRARFQLHCNDVCMSDK